MPAVQPKLKKEEEEEESETSVGSKTRNVVEKELGVKLQWTQSEVVWKECGIILDYRRIMAMLHKSISKKLSTCQWRAHCWHICVYNKGFIHWYFLKFVLFKILL